jgi:hypothetical protein
MGTTCLTKVLMDGSCSLNILYTSTLDKMGIPRSSLHPNIVPFYGIMSGEEAVPLEHIRLNITFGQPYNFCKEPPTFEVIDCPGVYHALLNRPCFAKFMAVHKYTYLKLKMPSPKGVITIEGSEQAYYYEQDCVPQAIMLIAPCAPDGPGRDIGRVLEKELAKTTAVLDRLSIGKTIKTSSNSGGSAGPSIQALGSQKGADLIKVSSNLSPIAEASTQK